MFKEYKVFCLHCTEKCFALMFPKYKHMRFLQNNMIRFYFHPVK